MLGNGAFGTVYKVMDGTTSTEYALKDVLCLKVTIFRVTLKRQKTSLYEWKPKNNGSVLFQIILPVL